VELLAVAAVRPIFSNTAFRAGMPRRATPIPIRRLVARLPAAGSRYPSHDPNLTAHGPILAASSPLKSGVSPHFPQSRL